MHWGTTILAIAVASGCGSSLSDDGHAGPDFSLDAGTGGGSGAMPPAAPTTFTVQLVRDGVTGMQRVNFAVPFAAGAVMDANAIKIISGDDEVPAARRALASYADGSVRSAQL